MKSESNASAAMMNRGQFMLAVFLLTFSSLIFQIVQTRILSVIAWYYLAFFAISVAMLGMTVGAVWIYLNRDKYDPRQLPAMLAKNALLAALTMPASVIFQFTLILKLELSFTTLAAWTLLMGAMTVPYIFVGVAVSLALTRSPFKVSQVYGVDLAGAALGCLAVIPLLNLLDGPSAIIIAGAFAALASHFFARAGNLPAGASWIKRPVTLAVVLLAFGVIGGLTPVGLRPLIVKDAFEPPPQKRFEQWNSYSRIMATPPITTKPFLWGPAANTPEYKVEAIGLNIDGLAGTWMHRWDGNDASIDFLRHDLVNLAYRLPGINKSAVIGVGGGRDVMSAHLFGVKDITGVELNPIFVGMHLDNPKYNQFSGLKNMPGVKLHVDDARSWFASSDEQFDLIQMSMIDTWAATGAGAFSLSENGLYTLEGWRAFIGRLTDNGVFTVSRWYNPGDNNETGRMIALATAAVLDAGNSDARPHLLVATGKHIATLVLSRKPFTAEQLALLRKEIEAGGFGVLLAPDQPPESELLQAIVNGKSIDEIDAAVADAYLDLSVATDDRPFFFNQLKPTRIIEGARNLVRGKLGNGVLRGNLFASATLLVILGIAIVAVVATIVVPLSGARKGAAPALVKAGTAYFALIGMGFMFAEISLMQSFSVFLGHPIYALSVCLFCLILSTGLGSMASGALRSSSLPTRGFLIGWPLVVAAYLLGLVAILSDVFASMTAEALPVRIIVTVAFVFPLGFLLGFAFPVGMRLVEAIDAQPTPWFWGTNGAAGVLASVLAVMSGISLGISKTMMMAALCYLAIIPAALMLMRLNPKPASA